MDIKDTCKQLQVQGMRTMKIREVISNIRLHT